MPDFRYAQFCPLARASEILAERWTLPLIRELLVGPQRFSDLRRRLPGLSPSVLSERLERLCGAGVVSRQKLPAPAASSVYELSESGRALEPALIELTRWGVRFLGPLRPGDHYEPDWLVLGLTAFARRSSSPARRIELRVPRAGLPDVRVRAEGGPGGTRVDTSQEPVELSVSGPALLLLGLASGVADRAAALAAGRITCTGDLGALADLPQLFDFAGVVAPAPTTPNPHPKE